MSRYNGIRPVTNGLVFCVDAANPQSIISGQTTWKDLTFNTTGGTLVNGVGFSGSGVSSGLVFDGTDDYVIVNSDSIITPRTNNFTIDSWFKPNNAGNYSPLFVSNITNGIWWGWGLAGPTQRFVIRAYNVANRLEYLTVPANNQWMNAIGTRVGNKLTLYYNGTTVQTSTTTQDFVQSDVYIGSDGYLGSPEFFRGQIASTKYYNIGLSPFEVYQNFNALKGRYGIPDIVTAGLILNLDAGNPYSYNPDNTGSTVWTDVTYNTTGGTLVNGTYYTGGTMVFDGVDDYVRTSYNQQLENFTICSFFKDTGSTGFARIVDKSFFDGLWLGRNGSGTNQYGGGCIQNSGYNFITLAAGQWHFLAMVRNGTSLKVYGDGITNTNTTTCGSGPVSSKTLHVGATINDGFPSNPSQRDWFTGNIANVQLYNRALTDNEILQNFNALRGRFGI
jgi:hypothetical protein